METINLPPPPRSHDNIIHFPKIKVAYCLKIYPYHKIAIWRPKGFFNLKSSFINVLVGSFRFIWIWRICHFCWLVLISADLFQYQVHIRNRIRTNITKFKILGIFLYFIKRVNAFNLRQLLSHVAVPNIIARLNNRLHCCLEIRILRNSSFVWCVVFQSSRLYHCLKNIPSLAWKITSYIITLRLIVL